MTPRVLELTEDNSFTYTKTYGRLISLLPRLECGLLRPNDTLPVLHDDAMLLGQAAFRTIPGLPCRPLDVQSRKPVCRRKVGRDGWWWKSFFWFIHD